MLVPFVNHGKQQENAGYTQQRVGKGGTKLAPSPDSPWFLLSLEFIHMLQLPSCVQEIEVNRSLTCWPLDAIGVDLNSQNQQKGAGVHRLAVLLHFQCAEEFHSVRSERAKWWSRAHPLPQFSLSGVSDTEGDRAELVLQTDVRVNSSGKRFPSQAHFHSQPPLL